MVILSRSANRHSEYFKPGIWDTFFLPAALTAGHKIASHSDVPGGIAPARVGFSKMGRDTGRNGKEEM